MQHLDVWRRAGAFRKYLAGDWTTHMSITVYHGLISEQQKAIKKYKLKQTKKTFTSRKAFIAVLCCSFNGTLYISSRDNRC